MKRIKINRNNTNFTKEIFEYLKSARWETSYDVLKYYQNIARIYFNNVDAGTRGLLVYHTMGMGKSILAAAIAVDNLSERQPIVLLTRSLRENMRKAIMKYIRMRREAEPTFLEGVDVEKWIDQNFAFASLNASNMLSQMSRAAEGRTVEELDKVLERRIGTLIKSISLEGKLLIVDEAHNLFRMIINGGKNAQGLYDHVMRAKNLRIVFLSGTAIASDPFELVPCVNMLAGEPLLPESYKDFYRMFVNDDGTGVKNKERLQNRLFGLVSHVSHKSSIGKAVGVVGQQSKAEFPELRELVIERVPMDPGQFALYNVARDIEKEETKRMFARDLPPLTKPRGASSSYRVRSRQLSNSYPDATDGSPKFKQLYKNLQKHRGQLGLVYSQFVNTGGLRDLVAFLESRGWTRVSAAVPSADDEAGRQEFLGALESEVDRFLRRDEPNLDDVLVGGQDGGGKYALVTGDVKISERTALQDLFNSPDNKHGGVIDLLLVSSTGAEGLDLKNIRHVHILEPYWNWSRIEQVIARAVRNDSHKDLPPEEKNVTPYIYVAVPPVEEQAGQTEPTTDEELLSESLKNHKLIESFLETLREVSVECQLNAEPHCRVCHPDNKQLFTDDLERDLRAPDPCQSIREKTITARDIEVDGQKYYYVPDKDSVFDYAVYEFDPKINGYRRMKESDTRFDKVIEAILAATA